MTPWELTETKIPKVGRVYIESFRPLLQWTLDDVVAIHTRHGVKPNPLYLRGYKRVGCFPCIFAGKNELTRVADESPAVIDEIERMEAVRTASRGKLATFFLRGEPLPDGSYSIPIREHVAWARTARGGIQPKLGLDDPNEDGGCGTWGLCESGEEGYPV